jgi:hypothetical protein
MSANLCRHVGCKFLKMVEYLNFKLYLLVNVMKDWRKSELISTVFRVNTFITSV